ncbi:Spo0E family sporulation regulatory protein-aspartic acid phosphatase [Desulfosporosinus sp. SYSU MS00001]|uniref:Spo0E family sporulation regulatory protein-aspartic acid phosphatase n=1 Tax=Desulfosporosinus sp. SYSU MS00001 TaxID=3416284 RepID=UPI003CFA8CCD
MKQLNYDSNKELKRLIVAIEDLRKQLIGEVRRRNGLLDPEIIKLSQDLDISINQFYRLSLDIVQK